MRPIFILALVGLALGAIPNEQFQLEIKSRVITVDYSAWANEELKALKAQLQTAESCGDSVKAHYIRGQIRVQEVIVAPQLTGATVEPDTL